MYTDTKNLTQTFNNTSVNTSTTSRSDKSRSRVRQILKPLIRLLTLKSKTRKCHPNNIDLNNTQCQQQQQELQQNSVTEDSTSIAKQPDICIESSASSSSSSSLSSSSSSPTKYMMTTKQTLNASAYQQRTTPMPTSLISSVYIDKATTLSTSSSVSSATTPACQGCNYGRNCQHAHAAAAAAAENTTDNNNLSELAILESLNLPYLTTDDGVLCWLDSSNMVSEEQEALLQAWLYRRFAYNLSQGTLC